MSDQRFVLTDPLWQHIAPPWMVSPGKYWRRASAATATPEFLSFLQQVARNATNHLAIHLNDGQLLHPPTNKVR